MNPYINSDIELEAHLKGFKSSFRSGIFKIKEVATKKGREEVREGWAVKYLSDTVRSRVRIERLFVFFPDINRPDYNSGEQLSEFPIDFAALSFVVTSNVGADINTFDDYFKVSFNRWGIPPYYECEEVGNELLLSALDALEHNITN